MVMLIESNHNTRTTTKMMTKANGKLSKNKARRI